MQPIDKNAKKALRLKTQANSWRGKNTQNPPHRQTVWAAVVYNRLNKG